MKALILAAGYATRLYPLTKYMPKPLLEVGNKTILGHLIDKLERVPEIEEILIVTNNFFFPHFSRWLKDNPSTKIIKLINDGTKNNDDRLGSIGDMEFVVKQEKIQQDLLVVGGDNLFDEELSEFIQFFKQKGSAILLNDVQDIELAKKFGIVSINEEKRITKFVEKPSMPESTLASTLVYGLTRNNLSMFSEALKENKWDSPGNFIAFLSEREPVYGKTIKGKWFDIGSLDQLEESRKFYNETQRI